MKTKFLEREHAAWVELIPETVEEMASLLRFANNAKAEKPQINFFFSSDQPSCQIYMKKRTTLQQNNSIKPYN